LYVSGAVGDAAVQVGDGRRTEHFGDVPRTQQVIQRTPFDTELRVGGVADAE
jgi:hypothetical protein